MWKISSFGVFCLVKSVVFTPNMSNIPKMHLFCNQTPHFQYNAKGQPKPPFKVKKK